MIITAKFSRNNQQPVELRADFSGDCFGAEIFVAPRGDVFGGVAAEWLSQVTADNFKFAAENFAKKHGARVTFESTGSLEKVEM